MYTIVTTKLTTYYRATRTYAENNKKKSITFVVVLLLLVLYASFSSSGQEIEKVAVVRGPLSQYVRITGQVQSSNDASLSFQTLGQVAYVGVKVGDSVSQGKVLATLSSGDAQASLLQAQATLQNAQAKLDQLTQGARKEEVDIKQQTLDNAEFSLAQTYLTIPDAIRNVDATVSDVVKNKFSPLFSYTGSGYVLSFSSCDQTLQNTIELNRTHIENTIAEFQKKSSVISALSSREDIDKVFMQAYTVTSVTNDLVSSISSILLSACSASNPAFDTYRATLSTVRTNMTTLFSDISSKRSALTTAKNTYTQASRDLALTKAGTDPYTLKAQQALVAQAEAQVAQAKATLSKTVIVAPFAGTISDISIIPGETVTSGKTVIGMLATNAFEVEAKVPEVDIVKVQTGSGVKITLDAYGSSVLFPAIVTRVSPTATIEGNVPMYKVLVTFTGSDSRIRSGMTANVNIITQEIQTTLTVPARFVSIIDETKGTVVIENDGVESIREVELGIRGEDGLIEIKSGLLEGEILIAPTTTDRTAQKES